MHSQNVLYSAPRKLEFLKHFKCIKPSKEERIQSVLPKLDGSLACLMPSSAIEAANSCSLIALYVKFLPMALSIKIVAPCDKVSVT